MTEILPDDQAKVNVRHSSLENKINFDLLCWLNGKQRPLVNGRTVFLNLNNSNINSSRNVNVKPKFILIPFSLP